MPDRPLSQGVAEARVARGQAGRGQDQVAQPGEPHERLAPRTLGQGEAGHLGEATRDQCGPRVLAQALAHGHAGGDRDHVLERPRQLDTREVLARIGPEGRARQQLGHRTRQPWRLARRRSPRSAAPVPPPARTTARTAPPRSIRGRSSSTTSLSRSPLARSRPFAAITSGVSSAGSALTTDRSTCAGTATSRHAAPASSGERLRRQHAVGHCDPRESSGVLPLACDARYRLGVPAPQRHLVTGAVGDDRQGGPPGTGTDHRDASHRSLLRADFCRRSKGLRQAAREPSRRGTASGARLRNEAQVKSHTISIRACGRWR